MTRGGYPEPARKSQKQGLASVILALVWQDGRKEQESHEGELAKGQKQGPAMCAERPAPEGRPLTPATRCGTWRTHHSKFIHFLLLRVGAFCLHVCVCVC